MDSSSASALREQQQQQKEEEGEICSSLTITQLEQLRVEMKVAEIYQVLDGVAPHTQSLLLEIWRDKHMEFFMKGLNQLGQSYQVLDANRPWLCYWIIHSVALLGEVLDSELENNMVDFLSRCEDEEGGYGGGPGQMPHLATTYPAVNALITLGNEKAFSSIHRDKMYNFLLRMKDSSGSFRMHSAGELDVRACYTALSVASILNILDMELIKDVGDYIVRELEVLVRVQSKEYVRPNRCQTYEGGIAGEPGSEAHGGYTFCGLAAMVLIDEVQKLDLPNLIEWVAFRQGIEGGFQGRTNKLVDGCYSFWQGATLGLVQRLSSMVDKQMQSIKRTYKLVEGLSRHSEKSCEVNECSEVESKGNLCDMGFDFIKRRSDWGPLFDSTSLQQYILLCSQVLEGGFKDKPGKFRDHYHSCYCLSGLSICQYSLVKDMDGSPLPNAILGPYSNLLEPIHPLHNVVLDRYYMAREFFTKS